MGHTDLVELDKYDEIDLHSVNLPDPDDDPEKIKINDVVEPQKTEAYMIIHLPADCKGKTDASVRVKVNTGAGGNVMSLSILEQLYPRKINYKGEPTGLQASTTCLTAYNGTPILQYSSLRCPLTGKPGNGAKPRRIQSKWYVADTPGPAILGLPSCERLKVITLNCAVRITHMTPATLDNKDYAYNGTDEHVGTVPWQKALDCKLETSTTSNKNGRIISREQLIQEYPNCFKGVDRFLGTYKIHLKKGLKPVIHPQQKWPIAMHDILKMKLDWMEEEQFITKVTEPTDRVNCLAYSWKLNGD